MDSEESFQISDPRTAEREELDHLGLHNLSIRSIGSIDIVNLEG